MEFHGIHHGVTKLNVTKFHGIPGNLDIVILNYIKVLWDYMDHSIISMGITGRQMEYEQLQSSMEFRGIVSYFIW